MRKVIFNNNDTEKTWSMGCAERWNVKTNEWKWNNREWKEKKMNYVEFTNISPKVTVLVIEGKHIENNAKHNNYLSHINTIMN